MLGLRTRGFVRARVGALAVLGLLLVAARPAPAAAPLDIPTLNEFDRASVAVADAIRPCVVLVQSEQVKRENILPGIPGRTRRSTAQGSGVIIDPAGVILTNRHMVEGASTVSVFLPGGERYQGKVVGTDSVRDVAVVRISASRPLPFAVLGDSDVERPGTWVMAAGYPFGGELDVTHAYEPSVTIGIISATGREVESEVRGQSYRGLLQTDAAINPGNSGGPLVNSHGEVIGLNQAIYTPELVGANVGIGFAIPINARTKQIIRTLMAGGTVVRGYFGASLVELTADVKQKQGVETGVVVRQVEATGPAGKAGIKVGDVVVRYRGQPVTGPGQMVDLVHDTAPDTTVTVEVVREGRPMSVQVRVGRLK